jgi:altronate dehydratase
MTGRLALVVHPDDNVATLTDDETGLARLAAGGPAAPGIPYGHKVALRSIAAGGIVVKYGVTIGRATADIAPGEHVHVHNLDEP